MTTSAPTGPDDRPNLELVTDLLQTCWDPPRPDRFARFTANEQATLLFGELARAFPDARLSVSWVVSDDHRVTAGGRIRATHRGAWRGVLGTGRLVDVSCTLSIAVVDGAAVDVETLIDTLALAEQIGAVAPFGATRSIDQTGTSSTAPTA